MQIALYRGVSPISLAIRWITRSCYSHAAFVFDGGTASAVNEWLANGGSITRLASHSAGTCIEAWKGGVRCSPSISTMHTVDTLVDLFSFVDPLQSEDECALVGKLNEQIGDPYSYMNVLRFLTRRPGNLDGSWFCSELVFEDCRTIGCELLSQVEAWQVPPNWLAMSPRLKFLRTVATW